VTTAVLGLGLLGVLVLLPVLVGERAGVSPRVTATARLVGLVGWGLAPAVWLACLGGSFGAWLAGIKVAGGGCLFGLREGLWQMAGYLPAAAALGVMVWHAARLAVAARRAELRGLAKAGSVRRAVSGGASVWVVPSTEPAAYAGGLLRARAVVTTGLLAPLGEAERAAVCEHEAAHVRLGHPRVLVVGGAVAAAYGSLPPVRRMWDGLRRDLEAAADDEAVRAVGRPAVLSALVRVALLATSAGGSAAFGGGEHLRYRIARLSEAQAVRAAPTALVGSAAAVVVSVMAWSGCVLGGLRPSTGGVAVCAAAIAAIGARPTWNWGRHRSRR
jgi:Zn-dependent protease with chaperone function